MTRGLVIVSHAYGIAQGLKALIQEIAPNLPLTIAGGLDEHTIGTNLPRVQAAFDTNPASHLHVVYDLGSALMNVEMAQELTDKTIIVHPCALVEGAFVAATMLLSNLDDDRITEELLKLKVK